MNRVANFRYYKYVRKRHVRKLHEYLHGIDHRNIWHHIMIILRNKIRLFFNRKPHLMYNANGAIFVDWVPTSTVCTLDVNHWRAANIRSFPIPFCEYFGLTAMRSNIPTLFLILRVIKPTQRSLCSATRTSSQYP